MIKIVLKTHISTLFNYSINQGIFPNNLKIALTHPIHTGKSKLTKSKSNYRPVSIFVHSK